MPRFTDDDLREEHPEWEKKEKPYPEKQGEGPLFEEQHRAEVLDWVRDQDWYKRMRSRAVERRLNGDLFK